VDDYNRGWNDCVDSIDTTHQTAHIPQPWGTYMGHRMTPAGTKEFWGFADAPIPEGTKLYTTPPAAPVQNSDHEFKNFHRVLCERFGYTHDEVDWKRDQVSLIEWIAKQVNPAAPVREQFGPQEILQIIVDRALEKPAAQRQWVRLEPEEIAEILSVHYMYMSDLVRAIEFKLKEKNNG